MKQKNQVEFVEFDELKRNDFVTGFHKRKKEMKRQKASKYENHLQEEKRVKRREREKVLRRAADKVEEIEKIAQKDTNVIETDDVKISVTVEQL